MTGLRCSQKWAGDEVDNTAPFLCMRLMCSQNKAEIEAVQKELFKAGIVAETRNHPIAEALGIEGLELWVQDERDFFNASKLYARLQERTSGGDRARASKADAPGLFIDLDDLGTGRVEWPRRRDNRRSSKSASEPRQELEQASSLLEKEIEGLLERESKLASECASLRGRMKEMSHALAEGQATLARETENRAAAEKAHTEKVKGLQSALDSERSDRARAQEQLGRDKQEWQQAMKSREESLEKVRKELEAKSQLLQAQHTAVAELRKQIAELESQRDEDKRTASKAREETAVEREGRLAAEDRLKQGAEAQRSLEKQLLDQQALQQKMQAHLASINSLCSRLQAKRAAVV